MMRNWLVCHRTLCGYTAVALYVSVVIAAFLSLYLNGI